MISRRKAEYLARAFITEMRKRYAELQPDGASPMKNLEDYSEQHQEALKRSISAIAELAQPENEEQFAAWLVSVSESADT